MATAKVEAVKELTECSVCGGRFTRPKALPCQHCFCLECLESWLASSRGDKKFITCPLCCKRHAVPKSGIVGFPDHYLMNNLLEIADRGEERCAECSEVADIIKICPHCQQRICADCLIAHVVIKATDQEGEGGSDSTATSKSSAATSKSSAASSKSSAATSKSSAASSKPSTMTSQASAGLSRTLANIQTNSQNQLPRNVDYRAMSNGRVTVIGDSRGEEGRLGYPEGCAYHVARREVYVTDMWTNRVMVYDRDGNNGREFYTDLEGFPHDVAVSTDGRFLYITASKALIKTNMNGERVKTIETYSLGEWGLCRSVYCYREFTLVVDGRKRCVVVLNQADKEIRCFGQEHLTFPIHLAVSEDGQVYVTDEKTSCVSVYSWVGQYVRSFCSAGKDENIGGITVDADDMVCVARYKSGRIDVHDPRGELITTIGSRGSEPGQLSRPIGLCLTPDGSLIVTDYFNDRVQIYEGERDDH